MSIYFFFFKQKTAYDMRISDWSSDVCSSDLRNRYAAPTFSTRAISRAMVRSSGMAGPAPPPRRARQGSAASATAASPKRDRKRVGSGQSVAVPVDLGGRRVFKQKNTLLYSSSNQMCLYQTYNKTKQS